MTHTRPLYKFSTLGYNLCILIFRIDGQLAPISRRSHVEPRCAVGRFFLSVSSGFQERGVPPFFCTY